MSPAEVEALVTEAMPEWAELAAFEHVERRGLFDITLARGGSRTRFTLTDSADEAAVRGAVAQICDGLRPTETPRRKVGGR